MQIPSEFRGRQVAGWIESEDYQAINTAIELSGSDVDLIVKKNDVIRVDQPLTLDPNVVHN